MQIQPLAGKVRYQNQSQFMTENLLTQREQGCLVEQALQSMLVNS